MTHTKHPPVIDAGLADGCPRCDQLAVDPINQLDDHCLRGLLTRALTDGSMYRSENEAIAARHVVYVLAASTRLRALADA